MQDSYFDRIRRLGDAAGKNRCRDNPGAGKRKTRTTAKGRQVEPAALAEIAGVAIMNARIYEKTRNDLSFWTTTLGYMQD